MAKQLFAFDAPPFKILAEHLASDEGFLSDARAVLRIDDVKLNALADALARNTSFLDRETLSKAVDDALGAGEDALNISDIIWRLNRVLRDADEPLKDAVNLLKEAIVNFSEEIPEDDREELGTRLDRLTALPAAFARQYKAQKLAEATGAELEGLQIICDIRPVFTEDRSEIEGAFPVTTLHLDLVELDGTSSSIEVRLTERQLGDLCEKGETARSKISVIKRTLQEKSIVMPRTKATVDRETTP